MSQQVRRAAVSALLAAAASVALAAAPAQADVPACATRLANGLVESSAPLPIAGDGLDLRPTGNYAVDQGVAVTESGGCVYRTGAYCSLYLADSVVNEQLDPAFATSYADCTTGLTTSQ